MNKIECPSIEEIQFHLKTKTLEEDLYNYLIWTFEEIKREEFLPNWHHRVIADALMKVYRGEITHLIINLPPRYTKTELVIKAFVSWCLAKNPKCKFIHLSYSDDLALDNSSAVREIVTSQEYRARWFNRLKKDSDSKKKWFNQAGGGMYATATGGQITGFGAGAVRDPDAPFTFEGAILIDDPLKPDDASSPTIRQRMNDRFNNTIKSRVNSKDTPIIIIMQRLHEGDMSGFLLDGGSEFDFVHLNLPAINEDGPSEFDPRNIGEPLWEAKHNIETLRRMEQKDPQNFAGQFQQRPAPLDGNIIKRSHIKYYGGASGTALPLRFDMTIHSWDLAFKDTKGSDFVVGTCWGVYDNNVYLLDRLRAKMGFGDTLKAIRDFIARNSNPNAILVEEKANGAAIIETLKKEFFGVIAVNPTESKYARFQACAPLYEAGNVFHPEFSIASWIEDFETELFLFPNGKHDDQVDSASQALNYVFAKRAGKFTDEMFGNKLKHNHDFFNEEW